GCLAGLSDPNLSTIGCPENFSFEEPHSHAMVFIAEVYGIKPVSCVGGLLRPVVAAVGCPEDDALLAYEGSNVGIDEVHTEKVQASKRIAYSAVLAYPAVTTIGRSEDDTSAAQLESANRSIIRIGKRNAIKSFVRSARLKRPGIASIGRSENQASVADSGSGIGIGKRNFKKTHRSRV